jgi:hypothetical protein
MVAERAEIAGWERSLLRGPRRTAQKDIRRDAGSALYCRPIGLAALRMCLLLQSRTRGTLDVWQTQRGWRIYESQCYVQDLGQR